MWVISGPFDGEVAGEVGFQKAKLLKTGRKYQLGRKQRHLIVNHKKISHDHTEFIVGAFSTEDVNDPSSIPKLEMFNTKPKAMKVMRGSDPIIVNPSATQELKDGDSLEIVSGIPIVVQWQRLCCYTQTSRGKSQFSLEACAQLGIHISPTLDSRVTHHLVQTYSATPAIAHSLLLATQFVRLDWLSEIVRLGDLLVDDDPLKLTSLEQAFAFPPVTKYRPSFLPSLPPSLKVLKVWEPNEARLNMFIGYRFLFVGEKRREVSSDVREMVVGGGGEYEGFDAHGGRSKLRQLLAKGERRVTDMKENGKGMVVVADEKNVITSVGQDIWKELVDEIQSFGLRFISSEQIVKAVIELELSHLTPAPAASVDEAEPQTASSSLPDFVPNTYSGEPSIPPSNTSMPPIAGPSRNLRRLTSSRRSASVEVVEASKEPEPGALPRKPLTRRARAGKPVIIGIDDPSSVIDAQDVPAPLPSAASSEDATPSVPVSYDAPAPSRSSRLKRRAGTTASTAGSQPFSINEIIVEDEPPLKKFKALFEASDPDRMGSGSIESYDMMMGSSGSQFTSSSVVKLPGLDVVREEEGNQAAELTTGTKRKAADALSGDDMDVDGGSATGSKPAAKKRAVESSNNAEVIESAEEAPPPPPKPQSKSKGTKANVGAAASQPDKDEAFLKALASTKRGKKTEDSFDREFNNLKIAKPELNQQDHQEEMWAILDDFETEQNIRGNFMVIVEMDVYQRDKQPRQARSDGTRPEWQSRPDFKRFKKKTVVTNRVPIELVGTEENDYGMGSAYWKGGSQSQSQSQSNGFPTSQTPARPRSQNVPVQRKPTQNTVFDSDEEVEQAVLAKDSKRASREGSSAAAAAEPKRKPSRPAKPLHNSQPLFLDSDEEEEPKEVVRQESNNDESFTLRSSEGTRTQSSKNPSRKTSSKKPTVIVDDDSDDGATFKGFQRKKKSTRN